MKLFPQSPKKLLIWLALISLLLACNLLSSTPDPTPVPVDTPAAPSPYPLSPTTEPATPQTNETPETPPTAPPETAEPPTTGGPAVLPAAIYFLDTNNQIMRLAADGLTLTQITQEPQPIDDFDVSPTGSTLVYVSDNSLIETDANGGSRLVKVAGNPLDPNNPDLAITQRITNPRYSPDGSQIAFGLNGVNLIPTGSATDYQAAVPSDPYPDLNDPNGISEGPIRFFTSGEWSPDGTKLAVYFSYFPEGGGIAIKNLADGTLTDLANLSPNIACCDWQWTADSSAGYVASNLLAYGSPGLARFDVASGQGIVLVAGLPPDGTDPSPDNPIRLFQSALPTADGSILSFIDESQGFDQFNGPSVYTMYRISPDGSALTPLRTDSYPLSEVLWADDGSGALIVDTQYYQQYPPTGPLRWLPADGSPPLGLPASGSHARWGGPAVAVAPTGSPTEADFASLETQALSDFGFQFSDTGINDLYYGRFNLGDGRSLWFVHTVGLRDFENQNHAVGLYAFEGGSWQQLAVYIFPGFDDTAGIPGPDYMNVGSVQQVFIEPTNGWLSVEGGIGAHGGTIHVLRFDGQSLTLEAENSNGSPGAGLIQDINGDGRQEVLLNLTDYYIFAYAAGVRLINYNILRWDGSALVPVTLTRLENTTTATDLNNQAISLTEAELWKDAREIINQARSQEPDNETIGWNAAVINTIANARENANSSYPIMDNVFFGDYDRVIDMIRGYTPADIFNLQSPLIVGTSAEGSESFMAQQIQEFTTSALTLKPDLAAAHFLRGWAAYLLNPNDPAALAEVQQAATLAPNEALYADSAAFLQQ
ncbi:MAG: hypothetical protein WAM60_08915 [Candidatus Promineifilaceae bacterium]